MVLPTGPRQCLSLCFVLDALINGRHLLIMPCINDVSRESFARANDTSLSFRNGARELDKAIAERDILKTFFRYQN